MSEQIRDQEGEQNDSITQNSQKISRLQLMDRVQLVIAVCAILISGASFYATYLQAQAESLQVKAATWPNLQFSSGNVDDETGRYLVSMQLANRGVGPANIRWFRMRWGEVQSNNINEILDACCLADQAEAEAPTSRRITTSFTENLVLGAGEELLIVKIDPEFNHEDMVAKSNRMRFELLMGACYCSLLDTCYVTNFIEDPVEVPICPDPPDDVSLL